MTLDYITRADLSRDLDSIMSDCFPLPSARELGISAAHRRAILRESALKVSREMTRAYVRDAREVRAVETIGSTTLEIIGGEPAADDLRASLLRSAARAHARAVEYLKARARGESARDINLMTARYAR